MRFPTTYKDEPRVTDYWLPREGGRVAKKSARQHAVIGRVSCTVCRQVCRSELGLRSHRRAIHPQSVRFTKRTEKPPHDPFRFAELAGTHHRAPDGTWVSSIRECTRADRAPKKQFPTMHDAELAARSLGKRYHGYQCSAGHFHVGKKQA